MISSLAGRCRGLEGSARVDSVGMDALNAHFESGFILTRTHQPQFRAVRAGELGGDVQAEAETVGLAVVGFVATEEALEETGLVFRRDGRAGIGDGEDGLRVLRC